MNTPTKLAAYVTALAVLAGGAWAVGYALGPLSPAQVSAEMAPAEAADAEVAPAEVAAAEPGGPGVPATADLPGGLASSWDGYTLVPLATSLATGGDELFSFLIAGPDGAPVTAFDVDHDKRMHLVVVRRDGTAFQHVHPEMAPEGTWSVPLNLPAGGSYRAFADFVPTGGDALTLGVDLSAPGGYTPAADGPSRVADVRGYRVELTGALVPGQDSPLTLTVTRGGGPVLDLQPYLGAYGHLVALREGDLAFLQVYPDGAPGDGRTPAGPQITFTANVPSAGVYRLFLDFRHDGVVRTAEFTVPAAEIAVAPPPAPADAGEEVRGR